MIRIKKINYKLTKIYRVFSKNTFLGILIGYTIAALTNIFPISIFYVFTIIIIIYCIFLVTDVIKADRNINENAFEILLRKPDLYAQERVFEENECLFVVGQSIEVMPHPELNKQARITDLGWQLEQVKIQNMQTEFDAKSILRKIGVANIKQIDDERKYSLVGTSGGLLDDPDLRLEVSETNFSAIMAVQQLVNDNVSLRRDYGRLVPENNMIPHSLCLHYIVRLRDGSVLCLKRDSKLAYHPNLLSFSGEEQLSCSDFESKEVIKSLFCRAICEEVLPLMGSGSNNWANALSIISSMRLWSVFVEERVFNYSLLGFYQLKLDKQEFVSYYKDLINEGVGVRDKEGKLFVITEYNLKKLLYEGKGEIQSLFKGEEEVVTEKDLHPSSRYRIFRLLRALRRGVLTEGFFR